MNELHLCVSKGYFTCLIKKKSKLPTDRYSIFKKQNPPDIIFQNPYWKNSLTLYSDYHKHILCSVFHLHSLESYPFFKGQLKCHLLQKAFFGYLNLKKLFLLCSHRAWFHLCDRYYRCETPLSECPKSTRMGSRLGALLTQLYSLQ